MQTRSVGKTRPNRTGKKQVELAGARQAIYGIRAWIEGHEEAQHRRDVVDFRNRYLPYGLLDRTSTSLGAWLYGQSESDLAKATQVEIDTPHAGGVIPRLYEFGADFEDLLTELEPLAETLMREFGWRLSSARAWLLVRDMEPIHLGDIRVRINYSNGSDDNIASTMRPRRDLWLEITAPVDVPSTFLLREIQRQQKIAARAFAYPVPSTTRPYLESTLEALRFSLLRNDGRSWLDVLREWLEKHPESEFELSAAGAAEFSKNVRRAYAQIMGRPLVWARRPGKAPKRED